MASDWQDRLPVLQFPDREAWRAWLAEHHATEERIWLVFQKKGSEQPSVGYVEAVEEALCFAWIDSLVKGIDARSYKQLFSRRKPGSPWARTNKERVERLTREGRMAPAGLASVARAMEDGSWAMADAAERMEMPPELSAALAANPEAAALFQAFNASSRKGLFGWIDAAKTPATRARRVAETVRLAALGLRANYPESKGR